MARSKLSGSAEAIRELRRYEPGLYKEFAKKLKSELRSIVQPVQSQINSEITSALKSSMPGMFHNGRSSWSGATLSTRVTSKPKELIFINATGRVGKVGFNYAELAGIERRRPRPISRPYTKNGRTMQHRVNGQGLAFNAKLQREFGKPGRFAWSKVIKQKPEIENKVLHITNLYNIKVTRRLGS